MANHSISMKQPEEVILGKDVRFSVRRNGRKLGELHVSKGNLEWVPAGSKLKTYRLRWVQVAALFEERGRLVYTRVINFSFNPSHILRSHMSKFKKFFRP
jgi:hypothetical protein